jgi:hypothetical protein
MSLSEIISSVPQKFDKALESGDVFFFPSIISKQDDSGLEVRWAPAAHTPGDANFRIIVRDQIMPCTSEET